MPTKVNTDPRDEILEYLKDIERNLMWLCRKIDVKYSTGYSTFVQKTINLSDDNLYKINKILGTKFKK